MLARLNGFETYYEEHGAGVPLVLVHGLGGNTRIWQPMIASLSAAFRVVAYDLRGLGRSGTPTPPYSLGMLVADLHALVERSAPGRVSVLGHSLGGAVALAYAAEQPERVGAVIAVSAPVSTPSERQSALRELARVAVDEEMAAVAKRHAQTGLPESFRAAHPTETRAYENVIAECDPIGYGALCAVVAELDLAGALGRIAAPVLLVHGELDRVVPPEAARAMMPAIQDCEHVELAGCGHVVPVERPDDLAALAREFVWRRAR